MFSQALIALLAATAVTAAPAAAALQSWQITTLYTHSPSGRPGNDPHRTLNFTIKDPNTLAVAQTPTGTAIFPPSSANCSAQWLTNDDVPFNVAIPCVDDSDYSAWSFKLLPGSGAVGTGATTDFGLEITLADDVRVLNVPYHRSFKGTDKFKVGVNLSGQCGGSGVCNWGLTSVPYAIKQTETT